MSQHIRYLVYFCLLQQTRISKDASHLGLGFCTQNHSAEEGSVTEGRVQIQPRFLDIIDVLENIQRATRVYGGRAKRCRLATMDRLYGEGKLLSASQTWSRHPGHTLHRSLLF